jgi:hypothetical protein
MESISALNGKPLAPMSGVRRLSPSANSATCFEKLDPILVLEKIL